MSQQKGNKVNVVDILVPIYMALVDRRIYRHHYSAEELTALVEDTKHRNLYTMRFDSESRMVVELTDAGRDVLIGRPEIFAKTKNVRDHREFINRISVELSRLSSDIESACFGHHYLALGFNYSVSRRNPYPKHEHEPFVEKDYRVYTQLPLRYGMTIADMAENFCDADVKTFA